ncbi:homoserine kinase [Cellulomonas cellasea]|uniref:homoserine kinase n=1 Tax=Cellulomonas cellasea TaxID=43670 RepID=UPI0025A3902D|nr:homoserine kinase [Cellulomonas cellasea]MDM8086367.1 homoserine kinase [Cellulomonas cellasea]
MILGHDRARARVPATSANLGPGFDSLGLALALHDDLEVRVQPAGVRVQVTGEGAGEVPDGESHLVLRALRLALDHVGAEQPGLALTCVNRIPHGRGLGSSAAAAVGGLLLARALLADPAALDDDTVLALATRLEGHPDNAAPALLGDATIAWIEGADGARQAHAAPFPVHPDIVPVVLVPDARLSTQHARSVLPAAVPHRDAAFQAGRAALLVEALSRRPDLLLPATEDRLHQEHRREVMPESLALVDELRSSGVAAVVSGAGPTVLALTRRSGEGTDADEALAGAISTRAGAWRMLRPGVDSDGARTWSGA